MAYSLPPDIRWVDASIAERNAQFESAKAALSPRKTVAVIAELKRRSGDLDILDKQIALLQKIVGSPLVIGNKVTLLQDAPMIYPAMFVMIAKAKDHINIESCIIEDCAVGQQFADLLVQRQNQGVQVNLMYDSVGRLGTPKAYFER